MTSKKRAYCVLLPESLPIGKGISTYNYQRTSHQPEAKHIANSEVDLSARFLQLDP